MKFFDQILDLVYPENLYCICCDDTMEQSRIHGICDSCSGKINWSIGNPFENQMEDFAFSNVFPCCYYGFYARRIISRVKLSGSSYAAKGIGLLLGERLKLEMDNDPDWDPDAVIAVPMHKDKMLARGFNQAELLACHSAGEAGISYWNSALTKIKPTHSMRLSDALTRRQMLQDAIVISEAYREKIKGKHIILIDDVITTGSTVDAASRVLLESGAKQVDVLCFAITPNKKSGLL